MAAGKFSFMDIMNTQSKAAAGSGTVDKYTEIYLSPYEVTDATDNTHKELTGIEELADSFLTVGQEQPTVLARVNGEFRIVDGHRRNKANIYNLERGYEEYKKVKYFYKDMSEAMYQLSLLFGNGLTQELTPYEKTDLAARLKRH
jgi:ParB-like chromosome segregation protein Spo0J